MSQRIVSRRAWLVASGGLGAAAAFGYLRAGRFDRAVAGRTLPVRREPVPIYACALPHLAPPALVRSLLWRAVPCWHAPKVANFLHALRLWGPSLRFDASLLPRPFGEPLYSPGELARLVLDMREFIARFPAEAPLLYGTDGGILVRNHEASKGLFLGYPIHSDDLLASPAEAGLSSETAVHADQRTGVIRDLLSAAAWYAVPEQQLEWTSEALARYAATRSWVNRHGQSWTFDEMLRRLSLKAERGDRHSSPCFSIHSVYAVAALLQVDDLAGIVERRTRHRAEAALRSVAEQLEVAQRPGGGWCGAWRQGRSEFLSPSSGLQDVEFVLATGHHLEWMALVPDSTRPTERTIRMAVAKLSEVLQGWTRMDISENYAAFSHAVRAVLLLSGQAIDQMLF